MSAPEGVRLLAGRSRVPVPWRLAAFYAAIFLAVGLYAPYWPPWLETRGLDAGEIGMVLALTTWAKVVATPLAAGIADRLGRRRPAMLALALCAAAVFAFYATAEGFAALAFAALLLGFCFPPLLPLGESLVVLASRVRRFDYGRVRLWGSLAFIAGAWGGGAVLGDDPGLAPRAILAAAALTALACVFVPDVRAPRAARPTAGLGALLRRPAFLAFLATASLIQSSHAAYYAFATLHWRAAGLDAFVIGALWAEGVAAEVVLFAVAGKLLRRGGVAPLFAAAAAAGAARWLAIGATSDLAVLAAVQALHAGSFGLAHLAAMRFIQSAVEPEYSATAQGCYSALAMGAGLALATMAAGALHALSPGAAFHAMAGLCACGGAGALSLARAERRAAAQPPASRFTKRRPQ